MLGRKTSKLLSAFFALAMLAGLGIAHNLHAASANIVWVSFHPGDDMPSAAASGVGFTKAPDVGYTDLLKSVGHKVTRYVTTATPDVAFLNTFDLVIISRSVPSGNYQTADSTALWHSITKPTIILGGYVLRTSRLGYTFGDTMADTAGPVRLTVYDPGHPIFSGVELDAAGTMVNPYNHAVTYNGVVQSGISVNTDAPVGTVLAATATASDPTVGGMVIGEFPAGTVMGNASVDITAGKRLVLLTGSRENGITSEAAGIFDLETDGARLFLNAVSYMAGLDLTEPPPLVADLTPAVGAREYYAPLGLSFRVTSGTLGGVAATNISLVLNGTDVSSSLEISGTPQNRTVTYSGLVGNTNYTGVLTVRDSVGHESRIDLRFDTLTPYTLPPAFAYPAASAVASASGFRALVVQGFDSPTLPNTADRAEAQLAGTLVDSTTGELTPNLAAPGTDNPNGAYNQTLINWSLEAGFGVERGNFQAPAFPDAPVPGVATEFNIAAEIVTYLELTPGRYVMGVNSDDGFVLYTGVNFKDVFAKDLGRFDGSRGSADTTFQFEVTQAGLYPFRLVYYQGDGGGNLEWFSVIPETGEKILINDRSNPKGIRAWREISAQERPYIASVQPKPGAINVELDTPVTIKLQDAGAQVQTGSVSLSLNGQTVQATTTKSGGVTTVTYAPAANLQSDTAYSVDLSYMDSAGNSRTANFGISTKYVPPVLQEGANIVWVSFHSADDMPSGGAAGVGFTNAPDIEYTRLLEAAGHTVTRYVTTATPDVAFLNTFDLVMISRSVPSGNYQDAAATALWHSITKPTIIMGGYIIRNSRLGYTTGGTIPDTSGTVRLKVNTPSHPIFSGIALDANGLMVNDYAHIVSVNGAAQRGISVNTDPVTAGGMVLATVGTAGDAANGGMIVGEFPAGTVMSDATADVTAGKRLVFLTGSREAASGSSAEASGIYDLEGDGAKMLLNAVRYMAGIAEPAMVSLSASLSASNELVISWPESGSSGYVLQATPALVPADWQNVAGSPTVANGQRTLTVPTAGAARFFRLIQP